jgi:YidC/Oxa1 family membrane protein insertase
MDKRTTLAFVLIGLIFVVWMLMFSPKPPAPKKIDSVATAQTTPTQAQPPAASPAPAAPAENFTGTPYEGFAGAGDHYVTIDAPLYRAILNTKGGLLSRFELKNYKTWYGAPVQLIHDSAGFPGELAIAFKSRDGKSISTANLQFTIDGPENITLAGKDSVVVVARLGLADSTAPGGRGIEKRFVFHGDSYAVGFDVTMRNMAEQIGEGAYQISWNRGVKYQEHNSVDESSKAKAVVSVNHDITNFDASDVGKVKTEHYSGPIDWVGVKSKYFAMALIPSFSAPNMGVTLSGTAAHADSNGLVKTYDVAMQVPYTQATESRSFRLFMGPLAYDIVRDYDLTGMIDIGLKWIVRPIGEYFMIPIFRFLHSFIGNYGLVIIIFSLLIRGMLWPLSIPQIKSSRKMQLLQPKITEIRTNFPDDPQRQQMETMNVYREYGVNPVSGCLPLLIQMPILYALWGTLSASIDLRQAGFALWIHDLSIPDAVITLPFSLPLLGNTLSGLALIMGATLFIQQKMMITDPKQKAMIYFMPVFLTVMFNHLPSGLNLYYLMFNLLSIAQQLYLTKYSKSTLTLEDMRKQASTKKKGWLSQKMSEAQQMAAMQQQGGAKPGAARKVEGRSPVEPRKKP